MRKILFSVIFFLTTVLLSECLCLDGRYYAIYFKDKGSNISKFSDTELLSKKSLEKRNKNNIQIDYLDYPIYPKYVEKITDDNIKVILYSKWLNCIIINVEDYVIDIEKSINDYNFVLKIIPISYKDNSINKNNFNNLNNIHNFKNLINLTNNSTDSSQYSKNIHNFANSQYSNHSTNLNFNFNFLNSKNKKNSNINIKNNSNIKSNSNIRNNSFFDNYGESEIQNNIVNGIELHNKGYYGKDVTIAILDDGFYKVNVYSAFDHLYKENRIITTKNFINNLNVYNTGFHGCMVLSTIAGYIPGSLIGAAPKANYMLFKTEDDNIESILEEYAWVAAAEYADSLGVDIISSTSVYTTFDDSHYSHTYNDLDGVTCPITIGAEIASSKGILVFNSAGNYGNTNWNYIGAPSDGKNVIAIGGINRDSTLWNSSSLGPTFDGRIKPDLCALSSNVVVLDPINNGINTTYMSGTSFAEPIVAGFSACLLEAFKNIENAKIKSAIYLSSDRYNSPNNKFGYGIPNFLESFDILSQISDSSDLNLNEILVYPNPIKNNEFYIKSYNDIKNIQILDLNGRVVKFYINKISLLEYQIKIVGDYNNNILLLNVFTDVNRSNFKLFSQK